MKKVAIIMGSDSDLPVVSKAADTLKQFGVPFELHIFSAHRTPEEARDFYDLERLWADAEVVDLKEIIPEMG